MFGPPGYRPVADPDALFSAFGVRGEMIQVLPSRRKTPLAALTMNDKASSAFSPRENRVTRR